ncbi:MAG: hypothetical protein BMS9Abin33_0378 [Gammaproteobacteria bacterium]|nr:MAG: hypothetical protein BMS9Abin33_0378 [Gammaproteobacteria bacterium]
MFNKNRAGILITSHVINAIGHILLLEINAETINPVMNADKITKFIFFRFNSIFVNASKIGKKNTAGIINDISSEISSSYRYIK